MNKGRGPWRRRSIGRIVALAIVAAPIPAHAEIVSDRVARWQPIVAEAAARFAIPEAWIIRVIRAESGGRVELDGRPIRSRAGAIGLMQLMPATWAAMRDAFRLGPDPDDPRANIMAGTAYLRLMYDRFGYPGMFAAYNAGPGRYAAYLSGKARLPSETIAYLAGVTGSLPSIPVAPATAPRQLLFVLRRDLSVPPRSGDAGTVQDALFAVRKAVP
ncbi:lytic transglycosylase domain-containing protein [Sphingomonas sp.]|uniref:lytic transglycosylase domain-containing protein n=1 Tax=Sphingomonas sp. TaxID=28214 RepID=UPI000DB3DBDA|nr:lytic transglycosylase domain-containing protein [Sphingomonas sp.]PZU06774.1 MAG: lytic transglycosylase domain-containing protein [Sphingomonas sp.]